MTAAYSAQQEIDRLREQLAAARTHLDRALSRIEAFEHDCNEQYRVMFEQSQTVKLLIDPETGSIVDANQAACAFYGYDRDALLKTNIGDINQLPANDLHQRMQAVKQQKQQQFEFRHRLANDELRDVAVHSGPIQLHDRTLLYSIIHDITGQKQRQTERRLLWHAINQSANMVVITDADGNIEYVNPHFTQVTGYTLDEVYGRNPRFLKSGYTSAAEYRHLWQTITSGHEWSGDFHNRKKDGTFYWEHARISPICEPDGATTHFVAIKEDITERVLAEQRLAAYSSRLETLVEERTRQLQQANTRMSAVLDNVSNPVILVDAAGQIEITNAAFHHKLGYNPEELTGSTFWKLFEAPHRAVLEEQFSTACKEAASEPFQARLITSDDTFFEAEVTFTSVPDNDGHVVCTLYDISHLKEIERITEEFVSMVSHELRTPISSILLNTSSMRLYYDRLTEDQKQRKVTKIAEQAQRLNELVTSILDISRFVAGQQSDRKGTANVGQALQEVVRELEAQVEEKQHHIDLQVINGMLTIPGEHLDVVRVWSNLLSNAIKYTDAGGHIAARLYGANPVGQDRLPDLTPFADQAPADLTSGRYIIGLVEDNGHGIPSEDLPQLFTRFYRGWAASTDTPGTGLGLSLVCDILRIYGGNIAVHSEPGSGAKFCFWLPTDQTKKDTQ